MKEAIITFVIALFLGSAVNGYLSTTSSNSPGEPNPGEPTSQLAPGSDGGAAQPIVSEATTNDLPVVNESNFDSEVIAHKKPVLVSFSRANCSHCVKMQTIVSQLAHEYAGAIKVVQADVMETPELAEKYKVYGVPAFLMFDKGKVQGPIVGETPKGKLAQLIRAHVKGTDGAVKFSG